MALTLDPRRTAVLPLDLQNDIVVATPGPVEAVLDNIARVLDAARKKRIPVVHVTVALRADYRDMPQAHPLFASLRESKTLVAGTPGAAIHPKVAPRPDELVVTKTCVDPFLTTNLGQVLHNLDVSTVVLVGLWTNYVVEATARHAADVGYRVVVVRECCASNSDENHRFAMDRIFPTLATVAGLDDVLRALA